MTFKGQSVRDDNELGHTESWRLGRFPAMMSGGEYKKAQPLFTLHAWKQAAISFESFFWGLGGAFDSEVFFRMALWRNNLCATRDQIELKLFPVCLRRKTESSGLPLWLKDKVTFSSVRFPSLLFMFTPPVFRDSSYLDSAVYFPTIPCQPWQLFWSGGLKWMQRAPRAWLINRFISSLSPEFCLLYKHPSSCLVCNGSAVALLPLLRVLFFKEEAAQKHVEALRQRETTSYFLWSLSWKIRVTAFSETVKYTHPPKFMKLFMK